MAGYYACGAFMQLLGLGAVPTLKIVFYTSDIRSMWGYIVFAFPFVRSFVRTYVRSFVRSFVHLSAIGSKFLR